ncbi:PIN domain-containing protein [Desulfonema limicola]|uniref:PIN domain-containing protein n=1 Tax=Desulfonema limicola TaxID=45656 RepID=A0A975GGU8_9BACT|nr:PIN domain-containing protein [Desulfonema limicola]
MRILIESEIILGIISLIESEQIELVSSEVLIFEAGRITDIFRKEHTLRTLNRAKEVIMLDDEIEKRAEEFVRIGLKPIDALHLSAAEKIKTDCFCTCDDRFFKKAKKISEIRTNVVSIFELLKEIENEYQSNGTE